MPASSPVLPRDLGRGLVLRRSTPADADALAEFNKFVHRDPGVVEPDEPVAAWTRDLLAGNHPTFAADDFIIVQDAATGRIVSSTNLISQTWTYAGVPFRVGRPELVGTAPEYRKLGLIRAQFEVLHAWSAERGEMLQAITGIPFYYRQFGYEMAMPLGGGRVGQAAGAPKLKEGENEPFRLRPPVEADLAFILAVDAYAAGRSLIYCPRDAALWRYDLWGMRALNINRLDWWIIERADGQPAGLMGCAHQLWGTRFGIQRLELAPGVSWLAVAPSVLRGAAALGEAAAGRAGKSLSGLYFALGPEHPFCTIAATRLPEARRPYAWYLRVPDLPGFVRRIAPALEARLAHSVAAGHTGELKVSFYREGLRLVFADGRLRSVEPWLPSHADGGSAAFPGLSFLQLLFGHRSVDELRSTYPDCWAEGDDPQVLLDVLFPKQPSSLWPVA